MIGQFINALAAYPPEVIIAAWLCLTAWLINVV